MLTSQSRKNFAHRPWLEKHSGEVRRVCVERERERERGGGGGGGLVTRLDKLTPYFLTSAREEERTTANPISCFWYMEVVMMSATFCSEFSK